ncbi:hypothetical protein ACFVWG_12725 [Kribbella sp. NPDC058245]|uniref:hypothetical protein n=1 Tax=Kribbella sp. NPDC058245 TaxID=3346399 RepID=UPI0036E2731B
MSKASGRWKFFARRGRRPAADPGETAALLVVRDEVTAMEPPYLERLAQSEQLGCWRVEELAEAHVGSRLVVSRAGGVQVLG